MFRPYTVACFGHRQIEDIFAVEARLEDIFRKLIDRHEYLEILIGNNGEFDQLASSVVRRLKRSMEADNIFLVLVLPYMTAEYADNRPYFEDYYDEIEICNAAASGHFKAAFRTRNRMMADRADLVVCCVQHNSGGAYAAMRYAAKQGKSLIKV